MTTEGFGGGDALWILVKSKPKPTAAPRSEPVWMSEDIAYLVL
ncbi:MULTISPECIES: hypothetical protein [Roseovarius]|nr:MULTISPECIES: hypothetical protein [Roseovarius]